VAAHDRGLDLDRGRLVAVRDRIPQKVRKHLRDASVIRVDGSVQLNGGVDLSVRVTGTDFGDDLLKRRLQELDVPADADAGSKAPAGKVEHVVDQSAHTGNAGAHELDDFDGFFRLWLSTKDIGGAIDRCQWIAQIVAEDGDELISKARAASERPVFLRIKIFTSWDQNTTGSRASVGQQE